MLPGAHSPSPQLLAVVTTLGEGQGRGRWGGEEASPQQSPFKNRWDQEAIWPRCPGRPAWLRGRGLQGRQLSGVLPLPKVLGAR